MEETHGGICPICGSLREWENDGQGGRLRCWVCFGREYLRAREERIRGEEVGLILFDDGVREESDAK